MSSIRPGHSYARVRAGSRRATSALIVVLSSLVLAAPGTALAASGPTTTTTATASAAGSATPSPGATSTRGLLALNLLTNDKPQTLSAPTGDAFFTLYVPPGTTPKLFTASLLIRGPVTGGIVTVTTPSNVFPINITNLNGASTFSAPLSAADVTNSQVTIHVHVDLNVNSNYLNPNGCTTANSVVDQIESATSYVAGGLQEPSTPADFWPPQLTHVNVFVPELAPLSRAGAASAALASLQVAATIAQQYGSATSVSLLAGAPTPEKISPVVRNVAIEVTPPGGANQISVSQVGTAPVLVVAGHGAALVDEARSIGVGDLALATANDTRGVNATNPAANPGQVTVTRNGQRQITLAQLGSQTSIEGLGTVDVTQFLSQSQFGAPIKSLQVRLAAHYTPPPVGGVATFSVLVGGFIVASQRLGTSGTLTMTANVPASVLSRTQSVDYRLDYSPPGGFCHAGLVPVQVTLNPSSGYDATPGQTLPPGFLRSPQDVAPGFNVALVHADETNLLVAGQLVTTLAQLLPYVPTVNLVAADALTSGHATELVVGATAATTSALHAPLQLVPFRTVAANGVSFGYRVSQPFAALEAFTQNGRDVIAIGAYQNPALALALTTRLASATFGGWFGLGAGQLAVMTPDGRLRLVGSGSILTQLTSTNPANNLGIPTWLIIAIAAILFLILARLAWVSWRLRRLRRRVAIEAPANPQAARVIAVPRGDGIRAEVTRPPDEPRD